MANTDQYAKSDFFVEIPKRRVVEMFPIHIAVIFPSEICCNHFDAMLGEP